MDSKNQKTLLDLLKTLPEGELREKLVNYPGDRINLEHLNRNELIDVIVELQREALRRLDPNWNPNNPTDDSSNFYDYWGDWNINNWGDFYDRGFNNL